MIALGQKVDVLGCVGKITAITDALVTVKGTYHYPDSGAVDYWTYNYNRDQFEQLRKTEWGEIDATNLDPLTCAGSQPERSTG